MLRQVVLGTVSLVVGIGLGAKFRRAAKPNPDATLRFGVGLGHFVHHRAVGYVVTMDVNEVAA